jgi:hypothetical protein
VSANSSPVPAPNPNGASEVFVLGDELLEQVCYGSMDAATAAAQFIAQGTEIMNSKK